MSADRERPTVDMRGAQGIAYGDHSQVTGNTFAMGQQAPTATIEQLCSAVAAFRTELLDTAAPENRPELGRRLGQLEDELADVEPAGPVVLSRWKQVRRLAGPLAASASVAQITDMVITLFGGG